MYALTYSEHTWISDPGDPDGGRWSDRPSTSGDLTVRAIHRREGTRLGLGAYEALRPDGLVYDCEDVPVGQTAYVVVVEYTTGDTFGYDFAWCVAGVYADLSGAEACLARVNDPEDRPEGRRYRDWDGYFEHLDSARIEPMLVQA